jgi:excisionase family DNA binding protein
LTDLSKDFATDSGEICASSTPVNLDEPFLTVREAAARLRVSTATLYDLLAAGRIDHYRVANAIRVLASAMTRFIAQSQNKSR